MKYQLGVGWKILIPIPWISTDIYWYQSRYFDPSLVETLKIGTWKTHGIAMEFHYNNLVDTLVWLLSVWFLSGLLTGYLYIITIRHPTLYGQAYITIEGKALIAFLVRLKEHLSCHQPWSFLETIWEIPFSQSILDIFWSTSENEWKTNFPIYIFQGWQGG